MKSLLNAAMSNGTLVCWALTFSCELCDTQCSRNLSNDMFVLERNIETLLMGDENVCTCTCVPVSCCSVLNFA